MGAAPDAENSALAFGVEDVVAKAAAAMFGKPLVTNVLRGHMVEAMIALALEPAWTWCSADYSSWDFENADGVRLEVKQSSYRQTWAPSATGKVVPGFDIRPRTGRWEGAVFVPAPGRAAHIYVMAYHDIRDDSADHRDPRQWEFYALRATDLPDGNRIGLANLRRIATPTTLGDLSRTVSHLTETL